MAATASEVYLKSVAATPLTFGTNNTERMRIDSSGNVGIGTSSPDVRLRVQAASPTRGVVQTIIASGSTGSQLNFGQSGIADWAIGQPAGVNAFAFWGGRSAGSDGTEYMRIDASGNVSVGSTTALLGATGRGNITINGSTDAILTFGIAGSYSGYVYSGPTKLEIDAQGSRHIQFNTNGSERARIDSSGNFMVGCTGIDTDAPNVNASIYMGSGNYKTRNSTNGFQYFQFYGTSVASPIGSISNVTNTGVSYNTSSDYRLKDIDGPIANSGAYIDALKPVQGSWKADGSRFIGLLAHEVQEVSETTIATGEKDGEKMQAMDYSAPELIANLIAEIQSLRARVAQLEGN
jgi:hypothetical protein